jgi:hypothetical protein
MAQYHAQSNDVAEQLGREDEESIALARMLMAEEAMESYFRSADFLRNNADMYSPDDLQAIEALIEGNGDEQTESNENLSYETMVRLGEAIGDVKGERWSMIARDEISKLEEFDYLEGNNNADNNSSLDIDDSFTKCLICQCSYECNERLRRLPCGHCFHSTCVTSWLLEKSICPYCRQAIVPNENSEVS